MNFWIHRLLCLPSVFFSLRIEKDCFLRVGEFFIFGCLRQFFWGDFALCGARPGARLACRLGRCCCFAAVSTGHPHPMDPAASPKAGETFINATTPIKTTAANQNNPLFNTCCCFFIHYVPILLYEAFGYCNRLP